MGRVEKSLLCDPGSELTLGGRGKKGEDNKDNKYNRWEGIGVGQSRSQTAVSCDNGVFALVAWYVSRKKTCKSRILSNRPWGRIPFSKPAGVETGHACTN